ncbi:hypothetical protein DV532_12405 [Pseudomonas sp. Leaf58]|nr:hypothetical protein DV532_12405 [Pseudomonas sp. Leaf58]
MATRQMVGGMTNRNKKPEKDNEPTIAPSLVAESKSSSKLNLDSSDKTIARFDLASDRIPTIKLYLSGQISAVEAAKAIGMKPSGFHKIIRRVRARGGDLSAVTSSMPGRRPTPFELGGELEALIVDSIKAYAGKAATIERVWVTAQMLADERGLKRPSYHAVRRRLLKKGKRFLANMRLGKVDAADLFEARPGYKVTSRPLEWVQIDHTRVDMIVVDEHDRTVIDRPWVSFAICIHTRAIVGFYLSLLPPNSVTVAMLIENCVLPKTAMLASLGLDASVWPMHGVPEVIHADNAAEFRSEVLKARLKRFGVRVEHRDVGKKHQGGHIERLIGTMMRSHIHFLRGTTYSNTQQRGDENSVARASISITALRKFFVCAIHAYNDRKHPAIKMFPSQKWDEHFGKHSQPRQIDDSLHEGFRYALYPERPKLIRAGGIEMHGRFYYAPCLQNKVREELVVKYDPNDLSRIFVVLEGDGNYVSIPEYRNQMRRSHDYALYRVERQAKGERDGTYSADATASLALGNAIVQEEYRRTAQSKRQAAKTAGKRDQRNYTESLDSRSQVKTQAEPELTDQTEHLDSFLDNAATAKPASNANPKKPKNTTNLKPEGSKVRKGRAALRAVDGGPKASERPWHGFSRSNVAEQIDFDAPPTLY